MIQWPKVPVFDPSQAVVRNYRQTDPETSAAGSQRIKTSDRSMVLDQYEAAGAGGLTDRELQAQCTSEALPRRESWRKRRSDLLRDGLLEDTGIRRGGQVVWAAVVTEPGWLF